MYYRIIDNPKEYKNWKEALAAVTEYMEERDLPTDWVYVPWLSDSLHCNVWFNHKGVQQIPNQLNEYSDHFELYVDYECIHFRYGSES